jgi:hypothetical protein
LSAAGRGRQVSRGSFLSFERVPDPHPAPARTGRQQELQPLLEAYGQRVDKRKKPSATGPYQHPLRVYLIDEEQQVRNIYSYGLLDPRLVITDARTLLMERPHAGSSASSTPASAAKGN